MGFLYSKRSVFWIFYGFHLFLSIKSDNGTISAVLAFGDSILDTGNNNNLHTFAKCNFPPYGRDFPGSIPTGRFSDGKVFSDFMAEGLGVKDTLPAYLDRNLQNADLTTGVCFASGGSGLDLATARLLSVLSSRDQLNLFREYTSRIRTEVGEEKSKAIISKALFLVSLGNNDIAITYYSARLKPQYNISSYTTQLVTWSSNFIKELYGLGARRIGFLGTLPLGCFPAARSEETCNEIINQAAKMFNSKLSTQLNMLNNALSEAKIFYIDVYNPLIDLIQNPQRSGFQVANVGCCCVGTLTCALPSTYVFWDSVHPTERAYRIIVNQTLEKYAESFS